MLILGFLIHCGLIYLGALFAQLEYVDFSRCIGVGCASYFIMLVAGVLLSPLLLLGDLGLSTPWASAALNAAILGAASAVAAKMVLSADWGPSWTIGAVVGAANFVFGWLTWTPPMIGGG